MTRQCYHRETRAVNSGRNWRQRQLEPHPLPSLSMQRQAISDRRLYRPCTFLPDASSTHPDYGQLDYSFLFPNHSSDLSAITLPASQSIQFPCSQCRNTNMTASFRLPRVLAVPASPHDQKTILLFPSGLCSNFTFFLSFFLLVFRFSLLFS